TAVNATESYTFTNKEGQEHIVYYTANKQTVTINYVDQDTDQPIQAPTTKDGVTDQEITLTPPVIAGYTAVETDGKYTFTAKADQQYTFYYKANEPVKEMRTITIKYLVKGTTQELQGPTTREGEVGQEILLEAPHFDGYTLPEYTVSYTVSAEEKQEYIFNYIQDTPEAEQRTVLIHHVDQETNIDLIEPTTLSGEVGKKLEWDAEPITVSDAVYTPIEFHQEYLITDAPDQEHTIYYKKGNDENVQQVLVKFVDKETGEELGNVTRSGRPDETITITPEPITVGDAVYNPELPTYTYTFNANPEQEYVIPYIKAEKPVVKDQEVTVKYLEQGTGTVLAASTTKKGKAGDTATLTAVSVSGYTPVKSTYEYTFKDNDGQEYIFYYTKNSPVTPSNPGSSSGGSGITPLPPAPPVTPLPPAPPKLDTDNHYNYINGYPDGMIKPENNISREEVAAIFYRLMDDATRSDYIKNTSTYKDVAQTRWSSKNIATMENAGIITGYPDGTFKPGRQITRAEFAAIASRFDDLDEQKNTLFSDIQGHWAEKYIVSAANKGWIKGYPDGKFRPDQYITRAEAMAFINSVLNRKVTAAGIHADAKVWPDNTKDKWYYADVLEATNYHDYSRNADDTETWEQVKPDHVYP
ncbi:S-layer homology domain-containing protein, partial [Paenibacillus dendrobii]|uniref:S-layer homology domain-containing protein n=1 Tax=Paenibacillus dendrobii TaxID=2691084 RepID=UPI0019249DD0